MLPTSECSKTMGGKNNFFFCFLIKKVLDHKKRKILKFPHRLIEKWRAYRKRPPRVIYDAVDIASFMYNSARISSIDA
jgi:hypothetical protein